MMPTPAARAAGIRPVPVPTDRDGVIPEHLAEAFARTGAQALFCQPAYHNPTGAVLAAHAAAAILATRHGEQMQTALSTRDRIGQAKGIIMERYGVDDVRAFEMLRVISRESHTKLADVAQRVIDTRDNN